MNAIKKDLLIDSIVVNKITQSTGYADDTETTVEVSDVLVQFDVSNKMYEKGNDMVKGNAVLFYDYNRSSNNGGYTPRELFTVNDIVIYDGSEMHVLGIADTPGRKSHHVEVILL